MKKTIAVVLLTLIFILFEHFNTFEQLEYMARDLNYQNNQYIDSRIIIVGIDDKSLDEMFTEKDVDSQEDVLLGETLSQYNNSL